MKTPKLPLLLVLLAAGLARAETQKVVFEGASAEFEWPLNQLNPSLPSDWSTNRFLVLELKSSTAQRFDLRLYTTNGVRRVRLLPFQGAWIRAALPLAYFERPDQQGFDLASLGNKSRAPYWINLTRDLGPLEGVEAMGVAMDHPVGAPTLEIRSVRLDRLMA